MKTRCKVLGLSEGKITKGKNGLYPFVEEYNVFDKVLQKLIIMAFEAIVLLISKENN